MGKQSLVGIALAYGLRYCDTFARCPEYVRFEPERSKDSLPLDFKVCRQIDYNLVENAIHPAKLGAKNWLFFGSEHAGHNAAEIYTLVANCRRHGIPVEEYLREFLTRLPGKSDPEIIASLTPARREKSAAV